MIDWILVFCLATLVGVMFWDMFSAIGAGERMTWRAQVGYGVAVIVLFVLFIG